MRGSTQDTTLVRDVPSRVVPKGPAARAGGPAAPEAMIGTVIEDRYQIQAMIASGGMARVYRGIHLRAGTELAIKLMDPELSKDPTMKTRCLDEARALMGTGSSHIVQAIDVGELPSGQLYLVMEYLHGEDLDKLLAREGPLPWTRAASMAVQICAGLASAHRRGIIHRDIKPQNCVRIEADDNPDHIKVIDFGIARKADAEHGPTKQGFLLGTMAYMAPEFGRGAKPSVSTDIYALGVTIYKLLTGAVPFTGKDGLETLRLHMEAPVVPPSQAAPHLDIPIEADQIIEIALAKAPADRFTSAEVMSRALRSALGLRLSGMITPPIPVTGPYPPVTSALAPALGEASFVGPARLTPESSVRAPAAPRPATPAASAAPAAESSRFDRRVLLLRAVLLLSVSVLFMIGTWLVSPAEAELPPEPQASSQPPVTPPAIVDEPAPAEEPPAEPAAPEEPAAPAEPPEPAPIEPAPPVEPPVDAILADDATPPTVEEALPSPAPSSEPELPTKPEPDFNYVTARKYVEDELPYLRTTCMKKPDKPLSTLKFRIDVRPKGTAKVSVFAKDRDVRTCVRDDMRFPFDPSTRGGAFIYTVTETTATMRRVPVDPTYVQVPAP